MYEEEKIDLSNLEFFHHYFEFIIVFPEDLVVIPDHTEGLPTFAPLHEGLDELVEQIIMSYDFGGGGNSKYSRFGSILSTMISQSQELR